MQYERILLENLLSSGHPPAPPGRKEVKTFNAFADEFLRTYVRSNNKPSVQADRECILRVHLRPAFGTKRLDDIGTRQIEALKANLLSEGLQPKTVNNILAVAGRLFSYAVEVGEIDCRPKFRLLKVPPREMDFLDFDEYERLVRVMDAEPVWGSALLMAGECGLRLGEILGLFQEDVDHVAGVVTVRRSLWNGGLGSPKGGRERKVPMTGRLAAAMRELRHLKGKFLWCDSDGRPFTKKMAERAIQRTCARAGLRPIGWHTLRHTYCSRLAMLGASPRAIQELAGHMHISTTMKYMHLAPSALYEAVALLDAGRRRGENGAVLVHGCGTQLTPQGGSECNRS